LIRNEGKEIGSGICPGYCGFYIQPHGWRSQSIYLALGFFFRGLKKHGAQTMLGTKVKA